MDEKMQKLISALEIGRKKAAKKVLIVSLIGAGFFVLAIAFLLLLAMIPSSSTGELNPAFLFASLAFIVVGIILVIVAVALSKSFKKKTIDALKEEIRNELFPGAIVRPKDGLSPALINKPAFFQNYDRYLYRDFMSSNYKGIPFEKGHYELQRLETHSDGHGHTTTQYVTFAMGTMYHYSFGRQLGQIVKVLEKDGMFFIGKNGLTKVETEFIQFNKKFMVLASDETTVFYILTPQVQEKIMEEEKTFKGHFYMAYMDDELFIAVDDNDSSYSISIRKPFTEESLTPIVKCLAMPAVFVNDLDLDTPKFQKNAGTK